MDTDFVHKYQWSKPPEIRLLFIPRVYIYIYICCCVHYTKYTRIAI